MSNDLQLASHNHLGSVRVDATTEDQEVACSFEGVENNVLSTIRLEVNEVTFKDNN